MMLAENEVLISRFHEIWRYGRKMFEDTSMASDARLILSEEINCGSLLEVNINRPLVFNFLPTDGLKCNSFFVVFTSRRKKSYQWFRRGCILYNSLNLIRAKFPATQ